MLCLIMIQAVWYHCFELLKYLHLKMLFLKASADDKKNAKEYIR